VEPQIYNPIGFYITDTLNWTKISGIYTAEGGEEWITIGNFFNDDETTAIEFLGGEGSIVSYYALDDVSIQSLSS
jgi:hypothetical protein